MNSILLTVALVAAIGLGGSIILVVASRALAVEEDQRLSYVNAILPGLNCGSCGYPGCEGYAKAILEGEPVNACTPGGSLVAQELAEYLGIEETDVATRKAVVACNGSPDRINVAKHYRGPLSCRVFSTMNYSSAACTFGCLGFGDCVNTCPFDAISLLPHHIAVVDTTRCTGCGLCTTICPRGLISLQERSLVDEASFVLCKSTQTGKKAKEACANVCIGCRKCAKVCPAECITIDNGLATIDVSRCAGCQACIDECPVGVISPLSLAPIKVLSQ